MGQVTHFTKVGHLTLLNNIYPIFAFFGPWGTENREQMPL